MSQQRRAVCDREIRGKREAVPIIHRRRCRQRKGSAARQLQERCGQIAGPIPGMGKSRPRCPTGRCLGHRTVVSNTDSSGPKLHSEWYGMFLECHNRIMAELPSRRSMFGFGRLMHCFAVLDSTIREADHVASLCACMQFGFQIKRKGRLRLQYRQK